MHLACTLIVLAASERDGLLSLAGQLGSMVLAGMIARFLMKSRVMILFVSFLGGLGAMLAHVAVDGQGSFLYPIIGTAIIYAAAVAGRRDLPVL